MTANDKMFYNDPMTKNNSNTEVSSQNSEVRIK